MLSESLTECHESLAPLISNLGPQVPRVCRPNPSFQRGRSLAPVATEADPARRNNHFLKFKNPAHHRHRIMLSQFFHSTVLHRDSLAKQAAAFFSRSRSILTSANSRLTRQLHFQISQRLLVVAFIHSLIICNSNGRKVNNPCGQKVCPGVTSFI